MTANGARCSKHTAKMSNFFPMERRTSTPSSSADVSSVLGVLDSILGGGWPSIDTAKLSDDKLAEVFLAVNDFYENSRSSASPTDELRVLSGYQESAFGKKLDTRSILSKLLYFDQVIVEDPVAAALEIKTDPFAMMRHASAMHAGPETIYDLFRIILSEALSQLAPLRPLIEAGLVIPAPACAMLSEHVENPDEPFAFLVDLACEDPAFVAVASEIFPTPNKEARAAIEKFALDAHSRLDVLSDEAPSHLYIASLLSTATLVAARDVNGLYLPENPTAWALYLIYFSLIDQELSRAHEIHLTVADSLLEAKIPDFGGLSPSVILEVRENDEYFAAWRSDLRLALSGVRSMPGSADFREEASMLLNDLVHPRAEEIRKSARTSAVLSASAKEPAMAFTVGAAIATGELVGLPLSGGIATAGATALGMWGLRLLFRDHPQGANAIIAKLIGS